MTCWILLSRLNNEARLLAGLCGVHGGAGGIDYTEGVAMYYLIKETFPVARKSHRCIWCGESILVGEKHRHEISKYDELQDFRWHLECVKAATDWFSGGDGPEFDAYENERPREVS